MANIFRGNPTSPRKEWPLIPLVFTVGSLLVTTLAPVVPPIFSSANKLTDQFQHPSRNYYLNLDTSCGSERFLPAPIAPPISNIPFLTPDWWKVHNSHTTKLSPSRQSIIRKTGGASQNNIVKDVLRWNIADTSAGTSDLLRDVVVVAPPAINRPINVLQRPYWYFADTSQGTPDTLQAVIVVPPIVPVIDPVAPTLPRLLSDTSSSTAKVLYGDLTTPVFNLPYTAPDRVRPVVDTTEGTAKTLFGDAQVPFFVTPWTAPDRLRPVVDTTQKQPITLQVIIPPAPLVNQPQFVPTKVWWQPADTSASVAKVLYIDKQQPFFVYSHTQPDRIRPVVDTSESQSITLQVIPAPIVNYPITVSDRIRPVTDTSAGTPKGLIADKQLPFFIDQHGQPDTIRPVYDTTAQWDKVLYGDSTNPVKNLFIQVPAYPRAVTDTTEGSPSTLVAIIQLPPIFNNPWVNPPQYRWIPSDTRVSRAKVLFVDFTKPIFNPPQFLVEMKRWKNPDESKSIAKTLYADVPYVPPTYVADYGVSVFGLGYGKGVSALNYDQDGNETVTVSGDEEGEVSHVNWKPA